MNPIAIYAASKGWKLRRHIVLVEGTTDEALFRLADELAQRAGIELLGDEISIVSAGDRERGGTFGVGRELITLRSMSPFTLDRNGNQVYRALGLLDNDYAGRRMIDDIKRIDRSAMEFRDILRLRPMMPCLVGADPDALKRASDQQNLAYHDLDWEIEDIVSPRLMKALAKKRPDAIHNRTTRGGRTHFELTRDGKREFHRLIRQSCTFTDLTGVVGVIRMLRSMFGLPDVIAP